MPAFTDAQIKEFESGAGYDQTPRFMVRFSDAIGSIEGRILRYLAHRTLGYGQYATVVSTRDLSAVAGTKDNQRAVQWLMAHGVIGREPIKHGGHSTFAYWIHTDFTKWDIPDDVWQKMLALREQGCWDAPRFSSERLQTLDRGKMVGINGRTGYNVDELKARIRTVVAADEGRDDRPNSGAEGPNGRGTAAPNNGAVSDPNDGAITPQYRGSSAPNSRAEQGPRAPEPQGLVPTVKPFEGTERLPQRTGAGLRPAPAAGGADAFESRPATATPSLAAPATPGPTCNGERTDCRPPQAGGETNGSPPAAGNGILQTERPTSVDTGERDLLTNGFQHLRVVARQMYRLGQMAVAEFDEGKLKLDGHPLDPGFIKLMGSMPQRIIEAYERNLNLPEKLRMDEAEYSQLLHYVGYGQPDPATIGTTPTDRFHPALHSPRYETPEDAELWWQMIRTFEVRISYWFERLLRSDELKGLEVPGDPGNPVGPLDLTRITAPPPEDPMLRRLALTNDLHHMRVIARQLDRLRGPVFKHVREAPSRTGDAVEIEMFTVLRSLQRGLAAALVPRYEVEVLDLPEGLRVTEEELEGLLGQVTPHSPPWRFNIRLHPPRYSEPEDRQVWDRCLEFVPDDLPDWLVAIVRSPEIATLERPQPTRKGGGGGSFRPDDCETEPYGTEEDGPQPP